ncbi:UDP-N-acetylmuramoyl-tripeptide--D-alanyl-D-alanine ligase [Methylovorus sp. MM2]|uniref:UDP-N-acetylmuramoyl-tripeptide--D-alanyl-D- alanine ligase n=1 Tax=Methylovorus sp. MM2 TaxID=1848038 RepID=UPI0007DF403C|nr:UDP-N-acetylmuramoyl-tripeptide--D-alanyl-D-alanine ligase [Methylovorus sp. MM2]OAM52323.1 UDP-N-acetylmuramoyl-tripeptide--D-alanyl-D-alanine ligase [Methylovorus sp. MM2]
MMRLSEAAKALNGKLIGEDVLFTSIGTDSRAIVKDQLFVALRGEHFDGNVYAQESIEKGAAAAMVSDDALDLSAGLQVSDTRLALGQLAAYWRNKFDIPLAAITGSNGKTTVKEMLASILHAAESESAVLSTKGNFNNDIGLPLTLLKLRSEHRYAVAEMGMNHLGEISYLTKIGRPTVALINNATTAHVGELGSVEMIAHAKGEIFEGLADDGTAIINADDTFAPLWKTLAGKRHITTFGVDAVADVSADYQLDSDGSSLHVRTPSGDIAIRLPVAGLHNVRNALAATAAALAMGVNLAKVKQGLESFGGVKGRLQHKAGINGALVIDDTYNANPASMRAAIDVLAARSGNKLLVLGDMGELGDDASAMHTSIGQYAKQSGISTLYTLGELSRDMAAAFGANAQHFDTPETLAASVAKSMTTHSTVLVKGSRFMRMERVVGLLVQADEQNIKANIKDGGAH